jgi:hypothetical protein
MYNSRWFSTYISDLWICLALGYFEVRGGARKAKVRHDNESNTHIKDIYEMKVPRTDRLYRGEAFFRCS